VRTFVNLDATNIRAPNKKELLCQALADSKASGVIEAQTVHGDLSINRILATPFHGATTLGSLTVFSLQVNFQQHLEALWQTFQLNYCQTKDYWPPGCSLLALQNKALDLSLVALSTQHLTLCSPNDDLRVLSLTAYNTSIGLHRSLMQRQQNNELTAILAVTSTVYALIEASLMQPEDIANFGWGRSGHFDGALALLQKSGPLCFSMGGFHLVYKKIREMGVR
jgi:hypothetical protein